MTKEKIVRFRKDLQNDLQKLEEKYGMRAVLGNIRYDSSIIKVKLEFLATVEKDSGKSPAEIKAEIDFQKMYFLYGLKEDDLGNTFNSQGEEFTFIGISPRAKKFPLLGKNKKGQIYKFPITKISSIQKSV